MRLDGRVAIVTGGAAGIGRAIATKLAERGASVVVADIDIAEAEAVAEALTAVGATAGACATDVSARTSTDAMAAQVLREFGRIDILVNNAGVAGARGWADAAASRPQDWQATYRVNVAGTVHAARSVLPAMKRARSGRIVNMSSISGREGRPIFAYYSASKAAIIRYTQSLAAALAPVAINVNAVCPGIVWTAMWQEVGKRFARDDPQYEGLGAREVYDRMVRNRVPLRRGQTPEDIAEAVAFLASDDARGISGQALNVDGGIFLR
ncbi:MAG: SDR family NAD(P)-dependent oxidoreductase [Alphaproteobacteria bacterium]